MTPPDETGPQPTWERFISGQPLSEELAEAMRGDTGPELEQYEDEERGKPGDPDRALFPEERESLRRLIVKRDPGWEVVRRIEQRLLRAFERSAMVLSEANPLGQKEELAIAWANVGLLKKLRTLRDATIEAELRKKPRATTGRKRAGERQ